MNPDESVPPKPAGVRLIGKRFNLTRFVVFVRDPATGEEVRVRVRWTPVRRWFFRCDLDGDATVPSCLHTLAAAQLTYPS